MSRRPGRDRLALRTSAVLAGAVVGIVAATTVTADQPQPRGGDGVQAWPASPFHGSPLPDVPVPDVALLDADGRTVRLAQVRGPAIVTFASAACEETCPLQTQTVRGALDDLGEDVPAFVVAVDPPRDTAENARRFLVRQRVAGRVGFLLGPREALAATWRGFAVASQTADEHHQARIVLIDDGRQRVGSFSAQTTAETLAADLRLLLDERGGRG